MDLRALCTFVEINNLGSFAVAVDRLGLTLSAVSSQIKKLKAELHVSLFYRSVRPSAMTPEARGLAWHARAMLNKHEKKSCDRCAVTGVEGRLQNRFHIDRHGAFDAAIFHCRVHRAPERHISARKRADG